MIEPVDICNQCSHCFDEVCENPKSILFDQNVNQRPVCDLFDQDFIVYFEEDEDV